MGPRKFYLEAAWALIRLTGQQVSEDLLSLTRRLAITPPMTRDAKSSSHKSLPETKPSAESKVSLTRLFSRASEPAKPKDKAVQKLNIHSQMPSKSDAGTDVKSSDLEFRLSLNIASELVQMMNWVLLTSTETSSLRADLRNGMMEHERRVETRCVM